jgi:Prolyl-tRNA synthetase, C-terminal
MIASARRSCEAHEGDRLLTDFFTRLNRRNKKQAKENEQPEIHGGFALARFSMDVAAETKLKDDLGVTVRCIPLEGADDPGPCVLTGKPATKRVVFAKAY